MSKRIVIEPVTRIEGHGEVTLHLDDNGDVSDARLHVVEFRGFEKFCEGRLFWEMPVITSRICGICPVSHHLASAKAGDALLGVELTPTAQKLRRLMHLAQYIQSHALHFFHLASPDLLLGMDYDPALRNVVGLIAERPDLARRGIELRRFGQEIIQTLGGKKVHPNGAIPGGMNTALPPAERDRIGKEIDGVIDGFRLALGIIKEYLSTHGDEATSFADFASGYLGLVNRGNLELYDGELRLKDSRGNVLEDGVPPKDYLSIIGEGVEDWSYLKFPYYKKLGYPQGIYRVGPLARVNVADRVGTPLAEKEFQEFKQLGKNGVVSGSLYYHYARMIEALYAAEAVKSLMEDDTICATDLLVTSPRLNEEGVGIVEAPRGTLIHHYWIDSAGKIRKANLIVATGHNNLAMNRAITEVARGYVQGNKLTEGMLNRVEAAIRCYDPCLSCATHTLGRMPLTVRLISSQGEVVDEALR